MLLIVNFLLSQIRKYALSIFMQLVYTELEDFQGDVLMGVP